jgi:hypothetical protein
MDTIELLPVSLHPVITATFVSGNSITTGLFAARSDQRMSWLI